MGILPFNGAPDNLWYFNTIAEGLNSRKEIGKIRTNYVAKGDFSPDYSISIEPQVEYESSAWNFLISWPGFVIFTPAWNGYIYYANVRTTVTVYDKEEKKIKAFDIDIPYSIRHAEFDRTVWSEGLGWLFWTAPAFFSGIYTAIVFDDDITNEIQFNIKDNYRGYVVEQVVKEIRL